MISVGLNDILYFPARDIIVRSTGNCAPATARLGMAAMAVLMGPSLKASVHRKGHK